MILCDPERCTGCAACVNSCPKHCIRMKPDAEGFLRPEMQMDECIKCGLCERNCPVLHISEGWNATTEGTKVYCAHYQDETARLASTSGGVFTAIASWVLQRGGTVVGAAYDDSFRVVHIRADNMDMLSKLRTAKYAQSQIGNSFQEVRSLLNEGRYVLFSGTPCQIAGLSAFLGKNYEKLILVDLICHGVPSPEVWREYIRYRIRTDTQGAVPISVSLRSKETGWPNYSVRFVYNDGTTYTALNSTDPFMRAFVGNLCLRPSCYHCEFKGVSRDSDFTLGDYWGVWDQEPAFDDGMGTSLVLMHSEKAEIIWKDISHLLRFKQVESSAALEGNPSALHSSEVTPDREVFMTNYNRQDFGQLIDTLRPIPVAHKLPLWKRIIKKLLYSLRR